MRADAAKEAWPDLTTIVVGAEGGVATIQLNRPDRKNSINSTMMRELYEALTVIAYREDIQVLVLRGAGRWFCPGGDIVAIANGETSSDPRDRNRLIYRVPVILHEMPQLTVAAIGGPCAGAGLAWACACDLRFASRSAKFTTSFLDRGTAGDNSLPWSLPRLIGSAKARELSFLPDVLDADAALMIGLVNRIYDASTFESEVAAVLARLAKSHAVAMRTLKTHYVAAERMVLSDYSAYETSDFLGSLDPERFGEFLRRSR